MTIVNNNILFISIALGLTGRLHCIIKFNGIRLLRIGAKVLIQIDVLNTSKIIEKTYFADN